MTTYNSEQFKVTQAEGLRVCLHGNLCVQPKPPARKCTLTSILVYSEQLSTHGELLSSSRSKILHILAKVVIPTLTLDIALAKMSQIRPS